jgi:hypothetical protein
MVTASGISVVVIGVLKVASIMGLGLGITTGLQYFNTYKFKPRKKEKGEESDGKGESLREKARSFS